MNGAIPVPGPTMMMGTGISLGGRVNKESLINMRDVTLSIELVLNFVWRSLKNLEA